MKTIGFTVFFLLSLISLSFAQKLPFSFSAKGILVLSDADMTASAYIDGKLKTEVGVHDALTAISFGKEDNILTTSTLSIPNSVTNWVSGMEVSPDGKFAFVIDTRQSLSRQITQVKNVFEDLPYGNKVYAVDLSNLEKLQLFDSMTIGKTPLAVAAHHSLEFLVIATSEPKQEICLLAFKNGKFGKKSTFPSGFTDVAKVTHLQLDPTGNFIAVTLEPSSEIAFYQIVKTKNNDFEVKLLGKPLKVGGFAGAGMFTPDGRYYLVPDLKWNVGYDKNGALFSIQFNKQNGQYQVIDSVQVGISPEGFAISPDGGLVATSDMGTNFMPYQLPLFGKEATISLLNFDKQTGKMKLLDQVMWEGILPEGIVFDADSKAIAVTSFEYLDLAKKEGGVHFWEIIEEKGTKKLKNTGFKISVRRGAHYLKVLK